MGDQPSRYFPATRHPWPCFCFLLPLLLAYEGGVVWLGGKDPEVLRNGADNWLRRGLGELGLHAEYLAPLGVIGLMLVAVLVRRRDRPRDLLGVTAGMAIESIIFALGLWCLSKGLVPLLDRLGIELQLRPAGTRVAAQVITFVGAGIYEEVLFRLVLFSGLLWCLRWTGFPVAGCVLLAALTSAAAFSAAHHVGPFGEPFNNYVFLFRTLAGVYFALLYRLRGFGVVVGAHAVYDILVGVSVG